MFDLCFRCFYVRIFVSSVTRKMLVKFLRKSGLGLFSRPTTLSRDLNTTTEHYMKRHFGCYCGFSCSQSWTPAFMLTVFLSFMEAGHSASQHNSFPTQQNEQMPQECTLESCKHPTCDEDFKVGKLQSA